MFRRRKPAEAQPPSPTPSPVPQPGRPATAGGASS
ncbi:polymer-forming cytoskeletal protein, partial [Komagataeibacter melaceti]